MRALSTLAILAAVFVVAFFYLALTRPVRVRIVDESTRFPASWRLAQGGTTVYGNVRTDESEPGSWLIYTNVGGYRLTFSGDGVCTDEPVWLWRDRQVIRGGCE